MSRARLGRALVALQLGRYEQADADLSILLTRDDPENAELYFARRALRAWPWAAWRRPSPTPQTRTAASPPRATSVSGFARFWPSAAWRNSPGSPSQTTLCFCRATDPRSKPIFARR